MELHDTDETAIAIPPEEPPQPVPPQPKRLRGEGSRVLLVDDDPDLRDVVAAMLEAVGLTVSAVGSAEEALELSRLDPPNLLVLDWNLPGMSGLDLCKLLRADAALRHLPLMFLTAHSSTQDMVEAFAAGADDYVVKPFRAAELGARIFGLLRRTRAVAPA
jgi:two-component system phosphate regulon response regulator PhoB